MDSFCEEDDEYDKHAFRYVKEYMLHNKIEKLGGVPHLMLRYIDEISKCVPSNSLEAKRFNFCVMKLLSQRGILKENPKNRFSL